jgi:AAA+ ATPase superfamily predicted ATPase
MITKLIGRKREQEDLQGIFHSGRPEFVVLYGRRRVGKTFLVRSLFEKDFAFHVTALLANDTQLQLRNFAEALVEYGSGNNDGDEAPTDWFEAFRRLRLLLEKSNRKRKVIFIDEMPWLDTAGSRFISALESFWNGWASVQNDTMLIVCGSAQLPHGLPENFLRTGVAYTTASRVAFCSSHSRWQNAGATQRRQDFQPRRSVCLRPT